MNRYQAREAAATTARTTLREYGFDAEAVAWIREQADGEFAALPKWAQEERVLEFLTDPRNTTIEFSRETKTRIFVKFTAAVLQTWPN